VAVTLTTSVLVVLARGSAAGPTRLTMRSTPTTTEAPVLDGFVTPVVVEPAVAVLVSAPAPVPAAPSNVGGTERPRTNIPDRAPVPKPAPSRGAIVGKGVGPDIEGYARYDPQTTCDPTPKPGTVALRNMLLSRYPNTQSFGISRACDVGGTSEHKEGRAFDWGANVNNAAQRAAVDDFLANLFATDQYGHRNALARRLGVMYVIWNQQIWGAYSADAGWRPYSGDSPHTDHVHISLSWAGARAETSFYSGQVVAGLPGDAPAPSPDGSLGSRGSRPPTSTTTSTVTGDGGRRRRPPPTTTTTTTRPPRPTTTTSTTSTLVRR
jgi:hypothetical protein